LYLNEFMASHIVIPVSSTTLLDKQTLIRFFHEICAEDEDIFFELLGDCETDLEEQTALLLDSVKAESWNNFNRAAHTIKSTAKTFGATSLQNQAKELEDDSRNLNSIAAGEMLSKARKLEETVNMIVQELRQIAGNRDWLS